MRRGPKRAATPLRRDDHAIVNDIITVAAFVKLEALDLALARARKVVATLEAWTAEATHG